MKKILVIITILFVCASQPANSQTTFSLTRSNSSTVNEKIETFLKGSCKDFMETFAHPTKTLNTYDYSINGNTAYVNLYYKDDYAKFKIVFDGNWITELTVVDDPDFLNPFSLLWFFKETVLEKDGKRVRETILDKTLSQMTGKDVGLVFLNILWNL